MGKYTGVVADRIAGVLVGTACGDALGAGYEFGPPLPDSTEVLMSGGGALGWEPGEWTDDTQMALAVLVPLAAGNSDPAAIESGFRAWYDSGPRDVGNQTSSVLCRPGTLRDAAAAYRPPTLEVRGTAASCAPVRWRSHVRATVRRSPLSPPRFPP